MKKSDKEFDINSLRFKVDSDFYITALGYALMLGHKEIFDCLYQDLKSDFELTEELFKQEDTSGLSIICLNNYIGLLQSYLPIFMAMLKNETSRTSNLKSTLVFNQEEKINDKLVSSYTPIQLACDNGHISIINFLKAFTAEFKLIPSEIDVHFIDPVTGNNCALIACKRNNFSMIKFLHIQCKADFSVVNSFSENAINVLCIGSKKNMQETFKCLQYLVEKVGIDPLYNYQESLVTLEESKSLCYLTNKLEELGVKVTKQELAEFTEELLTKKTMSKEVDVNCRFTFAKLFPELSKESMVSSDLTGS